MTGNGISVLTVKESLAELHIQRRHKIHKDDRCFTIWLFFFRYEASSDLQDKTCGKISLNLGHFGSCRFKV